MSQLFLRSPLSKFKLGLLLESKMSQLFLLSLSTLLWLCTLTFSTLLCSSFALYDIALNLSTSPIGGESPSSRMSSELWTLRTLGGLSEAGEEEEEELSSSPRPCPSRLRSRPLPPKARGFGCWWGRGAPSGGVLDWFRTSWSFLPWERTTWVACWMKDFFSMTALRRALVLSNVDPVFLEENSVSQSFMDEVSCVYMCVCVCVRVCVHAQHLLM